MAFASRPQAGVPAVVDESQAPTPPSALRRSAIDPAARFDTVRQGREAAAAQIGRTLKAWRSASGSEAPQRDGEVEVSDPAEPAEREADEVADDVSDQLHAGKPGVQRKVAEGSGPVVQRSKLYRAETETGEPKLSPEQQQIDVDAQQIKALLSGLTSQAIAADPTLVSRPQQAWALIEAAAGRDALSLLARKLDGAETAVLVDPSVTGGLGKDDLITQFRGERLAATADSPEMERKFNWCDGGPSGTAPFGPNNQAADGKKNPDQTPQMVDDHFAIWINDLLAGNPAQEPPDDGSMNCWESVLLAAYKAGIVPLDWIVAIHRRSMDAAKDQPDGPIRYRDQLAHEIGDNDEAKSVDYMLKSMPDRGDLLFMGMKGRLQHVAVYLGIEDNEHTFMHLFAGVRFTKSSFEKMAKDCGVELIDFIMYDPGVRSRPFPKG